MLSRLMKRYNMKGLMRFVIERGGQTGEEGDRVLKSINWSLGLWITGSFIPVYVYFI